jgi:ectoine hydroxylase-related dioxygenase (phytanoyl-CoA dioxygenase family)
VQKLLADESLLHLAQEYLGCIPIADVLSMWWHTNFHNQPDSEAAQFFHFDMDRIKWIKIFIYLTDVGVENGPHSFVRGSHRTGGIPHDLLRRGYARLTDEEVVARYPESDILSFTAPKGSIIIEDTRGLHKGVNVQGAPRLILQLQFSNSLFGAKSPGAKFNNIISPELKRVLEVAPSIYSQYI